MKVVDLLLRKRTKNNQMDRPVCCSALMFSEGRTTMRTFADTEVQARLISEMRELYEKRGKLEAGIRAVDTARSIRIEKDALLDIAAYRALLLPGRSV
jgi:hypothetical protein